MTSGIYVASISSMSKLNIPRGILTKSTNSVGSSTYTITYIISVISAEGESLKTCTTKAVNLSADSIGALLALLDAFWCPANTAGIKSTNTYMRVLTNNNEDTAIVAIEETYEAA